MSAAFVTVPFGEYALPRLVPVALADTALTLSDHLLRFVLRHDFATGYTARSAYVLGTSVATGGPLTARAERAIRQADRFRGRFA